MDQKYKLRITAEINEVDQYGAYYGSPFRMSEEVNFEAGSFLKLCAILAEFHNVAEKLKKAEEA